MIEEILHPLNLRRALRQAERNRGASGVDGMKADGLRPYFRANRERLQTAVRTGSYLPKAIKGMEIPKSNGKVRLLGIPTVTDRMLQQAAGQVLCNRYGMDFADCSYGFRPGRSAHRAVSRALHYIN